MSTDVKSATEQLCDDIIKNHGKALDDALAGDTRAIEVGDDIESVGGIKDADRSTFSPLIRRLHDSWKSRLISDKEDFIEFLQTRPFSGIFEYAIELWWVMPSGAINLEILFIHTGGKGFGPDDTHHHTTQSLATGLIMQLPGGNPNLLDMDISELPAGFNVWEIEKFHAKAFLAIAIHIHQTQGPNGHFSRPLIAALCDKFIRG